MAKGKPNLLGLKILVSVLGIAIFVCAAIIVVELIRRAGQASDGAEAPPASVEVPAAPGAVSGDHSVELPVGAEIVGTFELRGLLAVDLDVGGERSVLLIDPETGLATGTIALTRPE